MDLLCRFCREPWDNDSLHEEVDERVRQNLPPSTHSLKAWPLNRGHSYTMVAEEFRRYGCGALVALCGNPKLDELNRFVLKKCEGGSPNEILSTIYDFMGDDMDGAASMIEDAEHLNLL